MKFRPGFALGLAAMLFGASNVFADCGCGSGGSTVVASGSVISGTVVGGGDAGGMGCGAQVSYVEKTIMVPTQVTEMRTVTKNASKMEARTRTYTVTKQVPRTETKTSTTTVMVPKQETKQVSYTVNVPVTT